MSQNLLEVVESLCTAISTDPDNTDDNKAIIQALQHVLDQKKKKQVQFNRLDMPAWTGKALEGILKHPDQAGAARKNSSSTAGPSAPAPRITIITPIIKTTVSNTSSPSATTPPLSRILLLSTKSSTALWTSPSPSPSKSSSLSHQRPRSSIKNSP
jgi:hypothetical protein